MKGPLSRFLASIALACLTLALTRMAWAELPELAPVQRLEPTATDIASDPDHVLHFGTWVAIDGNTAMVGMPEADNFAGRVAVYERSPSGSWGRIATLTAPEPDTAGSFGVMGILKGNIAFIKANNVVYVFRRALGTWTQTTKLVAPTTRPILNFGISISYDDGMVAVGANFSDDFTSAVYVFRLNAAGQVTGHSEILPSDPDVTRTFGLSVALQAGTMVIGATAEDSSASGAVYVFQRTGNRWVQRQKIVRPESDPTAAGTFGSFGASIALNGTVLLVGDPLVHREGAFAGGPETTDGHSASGAVYVFTQENGSYHYRTRLRPTPEQLFTYAWFGSGIVTDGDRAVISAGEPPFQFSANGVAFVYERRGESAVATRLARSFDLSAKALSGDTLILGSPYWVDDDTIEFHEVGWADVFSLPPLGSP